MPQRGYQIGATNWDSYITAVLHSPTDQRALERTRFTQGKEAELDWFVRFARMDIEKASQGDLLNLEEEIVVLLTVHFRSRDQESVPSREQIIEIQRTLLKHLTELADKGKTMFPALPGWVWIIYPRIAANLSVGASAVAKLEEFSRMPDIGSHRAASGKPENLIPLLGELFEKVGRPIVRCPHCRTIFLQSRANQEFCSRSCQSVAVMQKRRAEAKAQTKRKPMARKPSPKTSAKGKARHGKTKR